MNYNCDNYGDSFVCDKNSHSDKYDNCNNYLDCFDCYKNDECDNNDDGFVSQDFYNYYNYYVCDKNHIINVTSIMIVNDCINCHDNETYIDCHESGDLKDW